MMGSLHNANIAGRELFIKLQQEIFETTALLPSSVGMVG
jgi:hypothetical protein